MRIDVYCDPGHGWGKVKKTKLKELGIDMQVSTYSYMRGDYAYLEEDCDLSLLVKTLKEKRINPNFKDHHGNKRSKIRGYDTYRPDDCHYVILVRYPATGFTQIGCEIYDPSMAAAEARKYRQDMGLHYEDIKVEARRNERS